MRNFPTPHCHPQSLDSASTPEAFAKKEVELGTGALTCTDHGSLAAAYKTYDLAKKNKLIPCIGLEGYFRDDDCPILEKHGIIRTPTVPKGCDKDKWVQDHPTGTFFDYAKYFHLTLGFRDYKSYLVGVKLISKADDRSELHGSERKALFDWDDIETLAAENITLGSGCLVGMISRHLINEKISQQDRVKIAKAYFDKLHSLFKDRFFIEVFPHVCSHNSCQAVFIEVEGGKTLQYYFGKTLLTDLGECKAEELADSFGRKKHKHLISVKNYRVWEEFPEKLEIVNVTKKDGYIPNECTQWSPNGDVQYGANVFALGMAKKYNIPVLVSDDSHFCNPSQKIVQDIRLGRWAFYSSYHRQDSNEAFAHFQKSLNINEKTFESWIDNAYAWADGFKDFKFDTKVRLPTQFYPKNSLKYTKELIKRYGRMPNDPVYLERLKREIELFHRNGTVDLLPYFWIDAIDACEIYRNNRKLTGPGRGSAGGVLLAYLLGITHVDPIKYGLSLERFLTLDRIQAGKWPDIDQDLLNNDLLMGKDCEVVEFEAEDGTKHRLPEDFKIKTDMGLLTVREAVEKNADINAWWKNAD